MFILVDLDMHAWSSRNSSERIVCVGNTTPYYEVLLKCIVTSVSS